MEGLSMAAWLTIHGSMIPGVTIHGWVLVRPIEVLSIMDIIPALTGASILVIMEVVM